MQSFSQSDLTAQTLLLAARLVIFLGVAGESFFRKTGIPDVTFLMIFGVILGPVFGIVDHEAVLKSAVFCCVGFDNDNV